ncbi:hypothetical protein [Nonomuraea sp. KM90]|uniref:hypothetical protein n=1 Tax=Nonomuraea sp. KM90 TaxID=3457428 RepID=UPI003FCCE0AC
MDIYHRLPARREELIATLVRRGVLARDQPRRDRWITSLAEVPRHAFVPARAWVAEDMGQTGRAIDRDLDPEAWLRAAYLDLPLITQRGGADVAADAVAPTSLLSRPSTVFRQLCLLDPLPGQRLLEVGTGTGYTAALLGWHLGDAQVTSIEIDPDLAAVARQNIRSIGRAPTIVTDDAGPARAPGEVFAGMHVTCGVRTFPSSWLAQTLPGGVIVAPWMSAHGQRGEMVRLTVEPDGSALGRFHRCTTSVPMRGAVPTARPAEPVGDRERDGRASHPALLPSTPYEALAHGYGIWLTGQAPHVVVAGAGWEQRDGARLWVMRLRSTRDDSAATIVADPCHAHPGERDVLAIQSGEPLWDRLEAAYSSWLQAGRPGRDRLGLRISPGRQTIWLDTPAQPVT